MIYRVIGIMSGSSLDGLDIAFVEFREQAGQWEFEILEAACVPYTPEWEKKLQDATGLSALAYQQLHADYGHYIGKQINEFMESRGIMYQVALIASHGHTSFHFPGTGMTAQLGAGAGIAAETKLPVVTDLRALDIAFGGQGAPLVPVGEKFLLPGYDYFLNIGGIANISSKGDPFTGFDVCPANRVLNMLANETGKTFDEGGKLAATGRIHTGLLDDLNALDYYRQPFPKSLANEFGTGVIYPLIKNFAIPVPDALRTYTEHIALQVNRAVSLTGRENGTREPKLLATGGGALNDFLILRLREHLSEYRITVMVPGDKLVNYKEAMIMAFMGVLRWRQEYNVLASVTGAGRDSIGGALWTGQEA